MAIMFLDIITQVFVYLMIIVAIFSITIPMVVELIERIAIWKNKQ